jgi:hypothetical protein
VIDSGRRTAARYWPCPTVPAKCAGTDDIWRPLSLHLLPEALERVKREIEDIEMQGGPALKFFEAW